MRYIVKTYHSKLPKSYQYNRPNIWDICIFRLDADLTTEEEEKITRRKSSKYCLILCWENQHIGHTMKSKGMRALLKANEWARLLTCLSLRVSSQDDIQYHLDRMAQLNITPGRYRNLLSFDNEK